MARRAGKLASIFLWLFVISFSLQIGAGLYEMRVVTPLWAAAPPASVRGWNAAPQPPILPRERFWRYCTPAVGLFAACALLFGWLNGGQRRRKWLLASAVPVLLMVFATYLYFAPALAELLTAGGGALSDNELTVKAERWLRLSRWRAVVYAVAWLAALRAFQLPAREGAE